VVLRTSSLTAPPPGVKVRTTVRPWASVVVMSWPLRVPERTTVLPRESIVVSAGAGPLEAPTAGADVMTLPPAPTSTLASGDALVTVCP
jgi:hypothetical protein